MLLHISLSNYFICCLFSFQQTDFLFLLHSFGDAHHVLYTVPLYIIFMILLYFFLFPARIALPKTGNKIKQGPSDADYNWVVQVKITDQDGGSTWFYTQVKVCEH